MRLNSARQEGKRGENKSRVGKATSSVGRAGKKVLRINLSSEDFSHKIHRKLKIYKYCNILKT